MRLQLSESDTCKGCVHDTKEARCKKKHLRVSRMLLESHWVRLRPSSCKRREYAKKGRKLCGCGLPH